MYVEEGHLREAVAFKEQPRNENDLTFYRNFEYIQYGWFQHGRVGLLDPKENVTLRQRKEDGQAFTFNIVDLVRWVLHV